MSSHFDERSGVIRCQTKWGCWWQTVGEVFIRIQIKEGTKSKDIKVNVLPKHIECIVCQNSVFEGALYGNVKVDETVWTIEDVKYLEILLVKVVTDDDNCWKSLLVDQFEPDPLTLLEMRKKIDLEKFQIEHPGFDFSGAKLDKIYD
ncbi:NUDCD2 (predicted) [Pycnogonum litorale]